MLVWAGRSEKASEVARPKSPAEAALKAWGRKFQAGGMEQTRARSVPVTVPGRVRVRRSHSTGVSVSRWLSPLVPSLWPQGCSPDLLSEQVLHTAPLVC